MDKKVEKFLLSNDVSDEGKDFFLQLIGYDSLERRKELIALYNEKAINQFIDNLEKEKNPPNVMHPDIKVDFAMLLEHQQFTNSYVIYWLKCKKPKGYENIIRQIHNRNEEIRAYWKQNNM